MEKSKKEIFNSQANSLKRGSPEYMEWLAQEFKALNKRLGAIAAKSQKSSTLQARLSLVNLENLMLLLF